MTLNCKMNNYLMNLGLLLSKKRVNIKNNNNGYAYMTCIAFSKNKPYYVLLDRYKSL